MITGFYGKQGSGKTLLSVRSIFLNQYKYKQIYSNIHLEGIKYKPFDKEFFSDLQNLRIKDSLVFFDEIQEYFNSRTFRSSINMDMGTFTRQIRKANNLMIWTSQFMFQVDKVLRANTDVYVKAHSNCEGMNKKDVDIDKLLIWYEVFEVSAEGSFKRVKRQVLNEPGAFITMYDSSQLVSNDIITQNDEAKHFLNMLSHDLTGINKEVFKKEHHASLLRFAKMVKKKIFLIYKIKTK